MDETKPIYPAAPLEQPIHTATAATTADNEQTQQLLRPKPPSYEQAINEAGTGTTPAQTTGPHTTITASGNAPIVVVTQPAASPYGPKPVDVQCPYCHNYCRTRIRYKPTSRTHLIALLLCLFQLYCCICIPYCIPSCMNANHYCGMCDHYLGTYQR